MFSTQVFLLSLLLIGSEALLHFDLTPRSSLNIPTTKKVSSLSMANVDDSASPRTLVSQGMEAFRQGDVSGSIEFFDKADSKVADGSLTPFLWQRGLSYYYADRFEDASKQFRIDVKVNPLDVEEIVWDIASLSRLNPSTELARNAMMSLPKGKTDRRKIMGTVYALFRGDATEFDLAEAGHGGNIADEFYSLFYLGLFCESRGEMAKASNYMKQAVKTEYARGRGSGDYMTSCARVHCQLRGWQ